MANTLSVVVSTISAPQSHPALYIGLVAVVANLVFLHATGNLVTNLKRADFLGFLFLYVGPLIVGVTSLFFLIKPLVVRRRAIGKCGRSSWRRRLFFMPSLPVFRKRWA